MTTFVLSHGWLRKTMWRIGLIVAGGICGTAGICHAQQAKGAKPPVQKDNAIRKLQPADVAGLPPEFVEKLNARGCTIPQFGDVGHGGDTIGGPDKCYPWGVCAARAGRLGGVVLQGRKLDDRDFLGEDYGVSGFAREA